MADDPTKSETAKEEAALGDRPSRRVPVAVPVALLVVCGLIAVLGFASASSAVCANCHAPQAATLAASPHAGVACERCHFATRGPVHARADVVTRMLPASLGGVQLSGPGRPMSNRACISCHPTWVAGGVVSKNGLRIDHTSCTSSASCDSCHGGSIHGTATRMARTIAMAECIACHTEKKAPLECSACHVGKIPKNGSKDREFVRTHGADWKVMHGTGNLESCAGCHETDSCRPCHGIDFPHPTNFGAAHGKVAIAATADSCLTCHKRAEYCSGCHGIEMPHPKGFLQKHGRIASSPTDPKCAVCHVIDDCIECHEYHVHPGGTQPPVGRYGGF